MPPAKGDEALPRSPVLGGSLPRAYSMHVFWRSTERVSLSTLLRSVTLRGRTGGWWIAYGYCGSWS
jgi:hypothetical protein